jgi:hypothetical protein
MDARIGGQYFLNSACGGREAMASQDKSLIKAPKKLSKTFRGFWKEWRPTPSGRLETP